MLVFVQFGFIGAESVISEQRVAEILRDGGIGATVLEEAMTYLRSVSFLGIVVNDDGRLMYAEDPWDLAKSVVLASRLDGQGVRTFAVHPAFRPYLEIEDVDLPPGQLPLLTR